jgi:hypothetical protein
MKKRFAKLLATAAFLLALIPASAQAEFGISNPQIEFLNEDGSLARQAGSHPFAMRNAFELNTVEGKGGGQFIDGAIEDLDVVFAPGFAGDAAPVPLCSALDFLTRTNEIPHCPNSSAIGVLKGTLGQNGSSAEFDLRPVYLLERPPGAAARIGFWVSTVPLTVDVGLSETHPYEIAARLRDIPQVLEVFSSDLTLWGNPADPAHDEIRGRCLDFAVPDGTKCPANVPLRPLLTLPRSCSGTIETLFRATPWWTGDPLAPTPGGAVSEVNAETPGMTGCGKLGFAPEISSQPSTDQASSPTGLSFGLKVKDEGLTNPTGLAHSDLKKAVVTLPEGVTINPSQAEGLAVCSEADLADETAKSEPGEGCPPASKVGTVEVESPLLQGEVLRGALFVAEPFKNRFGSLLAIYMTIKSPDMGIAVKLAGKVEPDPNTGQIKTTFEDLPQLPFSEFRLRFREGGRSPLISPERCGAYETVGLFTPWANPSTTYTATSSFQITKGVAGGACPNPGTPPFEPGFSAGTLNNSAAAFSPFAMRLTRRDGDQDLVRFDATLPPGVVAKLAGVSKCPDSAIAAIKAKTGKEELASPSCPANSKIGTVKAGAGVGSQLTYVPGSVYLAGPFAGAPLSVVGVVPAVAGPFDVGVVSTRQALTLDPVTAEVKVDGSLSEPIPHILAGIPLKVRDIQVAVDRPQFTLNPTSCEEMAIGASIWGGGLLPFSLLDDAPVSLKDRFQAANCALLGFKPKLAINLKGGTKRGGHPALRAVLRPRPGDANLKRTVVRLPRSAFLDQAHIRTVCTRVQFAADSCPAGSIYGQVKAFSPLLDEPLSGPAYLRSSDNLLPDLVFALKGIVEIESSARVDSVGGGIRATFAGIPDAPLSKVIVEMQGAKKGLIVNSRDLCAAPSRAEVRMGAHNGRRQVLRPVVKAQCGGKRGSAERR